MTITMKRNMSQLVKIKITLLFKPSFSSIRCNSSDFCNIQCFLLNWLPGIFAHNKTNLNSSIALNKFWVTCYIPLCRKDSNIHMHSVSDYIRDNQHRIGLMSLITRHLFHRSNMAFVSRGQMLIY